MISCFKLLTPGFDTFFCSTGSAHWLECNVALNVVARHARHVLVCLFVKSLISVQEIPVDWNFGNASQTWL